MVDIFILPGNIRCFITILCNLISAVLIGRNHRPAVLIEVHGMDSDFVKFRTIVETGVIEKIPFSIIVTENGIMSASHICRMKTAELIIAHDFQTDRIKICVCAKHRWISCRIIEWTVWIFRTEYSHIIPACGSESAVRHPEIIVPSIRIVLHKRSFSGFEIPTGNFCAEIAVHHSAVRCCTSFRVNTSSCCRVNFKRKNSS